MRLGDPVSPTQRMVLEAQKVMAQTRIGAYTRHHMTFREVPQWTEDTARDLVYSLESYVLTERTTPQTFTLRFEVEVPDGWFQALKAQRMRDWILRRWPVRTRVLTQVRTVSHTRMAMFPEASILPRELGRPVVFEHWEGRV